MTTPTSDEAVTTLTAAINGITPHLDALNDRIVAHDDQDALALLVRLSTAATELADAALGRTS